MNSKTWNELCAAVAEDHLMAQLLINAPLCNSRLERRMTALRRDFLVNRPSDSALPALSNLARQCFINEYAWAQDETETELVAALARDVGSGECADPASLLAVACYRPLASLPGAPLLAAEDWPVPVRPVLKQQITDGVRERSLSETAPRMTPIRDSVSEAVQAQYETNPYPRWATAQPPPRTGTAKIDMLIAGCGTGRSAISHARSNLAATVLAVDLSRASLGFAMRMAEELGAANISFGQADVLELGALGRTFNIIECGGVLHHMADPFEGAKVLAGLLKPGGMIFLSVYSATARQVLAPAQDLARRFPPTTEGIRALRQAVAQSPPGDPLLAATGFGDFYSISGCRDLLMHTHEQRLDITDIRRILDENGLEFRGFIVHPEVKSAYAAQFPDDPEGLNLDQWAAFEQANRATFIGMYQFWARRSG